MLIHTCTRYGVLKALMRPMRHEMKRVTSNDDQGGRGRRGARGRAALAQAPTNDKWSGTHVDPSHQTRERFLALLKNAFLSRPGTHSYTDAPARMQT
jgi:hypothetical protein